MFGLKNFYHTLNQLQNDAKLEPIIAWPPVFSQALDSLLGFSLSFHGFLLLWYFSLFFLLVVVITVVLVLLHSIKECCNI